MTEELIETYIPDDISIKEFFSLNKNAEFVFFSTNAQKNYCHVKYKHSVFLVFGKETRGLPEELIQTNMNRSVRIPILKQARSLNLATSVAVAVYEVLRQNGFENMEVTEKLGINR